MVETDLSMDQRPAHPQDLPTLNSIKVVFFFSGNFHCQMELFDEYSTFVSECPSMHKNGLQKNFIRRLLAVSKIKRATKDEEKVAILDAIHMLHSSWTNVSVLKAALGKQGFRFQLKMNIRRQKVKEKMI